MNEIRLKTGDCIAAVGCSDGQRPERKPLYEELRIILHRQGLNPQFSECIWCDAEGNSRSGKERAEALMNAYRNPDIRAIMDVSGGDLANTVLPYLDFAVIAANPKTFWGYSDLTVLLNAFYAKTGHPQVLYQIRHLADQDALLQQNRFHAFMQGEEDLMNLNCYFRQGQEMQGILIGGNIRCFLKLAGTEYFPDTDHSILLLEAFHGRREQIETYYAQLHAMGVFAGVSGILLGTFTQLDEENGTGLKYELLKPYLPAGLPVAVTAQVGHRTDAKAAVIGAEYQFSASTDPHF